MKRLLEKARSHIMVRWLVAALVIGLLAGVGGWLRLQSVAKSPVGDSKLSARVERIGIGALGRLEPGWKVLQIAPASAPEGGRVEVLAVEEGEQVQVGTVLAILDTNARRQTALQEANAQVRVARARLALVMAGVKPEEIAAQEALIAKHRASLENAATVFQRAERLFGKQVSTREDFDQRKMDLAFQQASLEQAEKTLAAMKFIRPEDIAVAEAELSKAEAGVARAQAELEATRVIAPIAGRVLKVHARAGERIGENGLMELGDTSAMHAVAEVYERDAPRLRPGQPAIVKVQSLPKELRGEVVHVGWRVGRRTVLDNDPVKDTDARIVEVRIKLDAASSARVAGLSYARVEVRIDAPALNEEP